MVAVAGALVSLVATVALSGCSNDEGPNVLVIGDSLTFGAQQRGLGEGPGTWTIDGVIGRTTSEGVEVADEADLADVDEVIVALGTNDYLDDEETYAARIDAMMAALGADVPVTWINVDTGTTKLAPAADGVNAALTAAADRFPNLEVADWSAYVASRDDEDELRGGDGVHYTSAGYDVRAEWTQDLVSS